MEQEINSGRLARRPERTETRTDEEVDQYIEIARHSVSVINSVIARANGQILTDSDKDEIGRNVGHLEGVITQPWIRQTNQDLSDIEEAIVNGNAAVQ